MSKESDLQDATDRALSNAQDQSQKVLDMARESLSPVKDIALYQMFHGDATDPFNDLAKQTADFMPDLIKQLKDLSGFSFDSLPPAFKDVITNLKDIQAGYWNISNTGGRTQETAAALSQLSNIMNGTTIPQAERFNAANAMLQDKGYTQGLKDVQEIARGLTSKGGFTEGLTTLSRTGTEILAQGGRTAELNAMSAAGQQLLAAGGMTPELAKMFEQIQTGQGTAGFSPEMRQMYEQMQSIIGAGGQGGALLPMETVMSFARDAAATGAAQQAEGVRRQAIAQGGASVFAGGTAQALSEFSDQALRAEGQATREAATSQQGLQLQQLMSAVQAGTTLTGQANAVVNALMGMGVEVAMAASQNLATGGTLMSNAEQLVALRLQSGGNMLSSAEEQASKRLMFGTESLYGVEDLAGRFRNDAMNQMAGLTQESLDAIQGIGDISQLESDRLFRALAGRATIEGTIGDIYGSQQGVGLQNIVTQGNIFNQGITTQANLTQMGQGNIQEYLKILNQTGGTYMPLANTALGQQGDALGSAQDFAGQKYLQPSFLDTLGQTFAGGFGKSLGEGLGKGISGGIGGAIGG